MKLDTDEVPALSPTWPRTTLMAAAGVVAIGIVLRFWTHSHLWLNEALTVNIARLPLHQIPTALRHDDTPPLYYFLLHGWMALFGTSTWAVRALSGLISVATLPVMASAARRIAGASGAHETGNANETGKMAGAVGVLLLASSPYAVHYATEARMYSLIILLVLVGYVFIARLLEVPDPGWRHLAPLSVVSGMLLLTHYWSIYLLVVVAGVLACLGWRAGPGHGGRWWKGVGAIAAGGILFLPWLSSFVFQIRHTGTPWSEPASFGGLVNAVSEFSGGRPTSGRALGVIFLALAAFGLLGAALGPARIELDLRTRPRARGAAAVLAGTLAVSLVFTLLSDSGLTDRYFAVVFAPFLLLVTLGATVLADRRVLAGWLAAAVALGLFTCTGNVRQDRTQAGQLAAAIRRDVQPGDVVAYCPDQLGPSISRLLPRGVTQVTFPALAGPKFVDWVSYAARNRAADPAAFARSLAQMAGSGHAVWLVWGSQYRTLGTRCEQTVNSLAAIRPGLQQVVTADEVHFHERASLVRSPPR